MYRWLSSRSAWITTVLRYAVPCSTVPCCATVGLENPEMRRKVLEERDRAAVEEPGADEALAAMEAPAGQGVREEFERRQAAWKGRLRSFWRMDDGW
jgi:hypothetical protein